MQNKITVFSAAVIFFIFAGCAATKPVDPNWMPPQSVAVLPFDNMSLDENGPVLVRLIFIGYLTNMGYIVQAPDRTDAILRDLGITYGGQLNSITPGELVRKLGVDGLIYGTVLKFEYTVGLIDTKKGVRLRASFLDGWRNVSLWESEQGYEESKSRLGFLIDKPRDIFKDTASDFGRDLMTKAALGSLKGLIGNPLFPQADRAVGLTIASLPDYQPGYEAPPEDISNTNNDDSDTN
jgi:hypothetical protein